jgi:uncharacterized protein
MSTYLSDRNERKYALPGVYLETEFRQPRRDPFATGVPVFIGFCRKIKDEKKLGQLQQLALWSHFMDHIGEPDKDCRLAYAVRGFFQNGGRRCYVIVIRDEEPVDPATLLGALDLAAKFRSIDLVCVTDLGECRDAAIELQKMILTHCDETGDRFGILDSWPGDGPEVLSEVWSKLFGTNGALYYPWIEVRRFEDGDTAETKILVPPCGHIAGVYARTDQSRGVHKAPANEALEGVLSLAPGASDVKHEVAGPSRVNRIRSFPGRGIRVWGARTLSFNDAWTFINVRRLFLTAIRWLEWHMRDVAFEPNDPKLWARIEGELHQYFLGLYRQGALQGPTATDAYYVKCDPSNNPRELIEQGQVVAEIGLAATTPFEFVVVRLIYGASGVSISGPIRPEQNS